MYSDDWDANVNLGPAGASLSNAVAEGAIVFAAIFGRFASGEFGKEGGAWSEVSVAGGGGVVVLVMTLARPTSGIASDSIANSDMPLEKDALSDQLQRVNLFGPFALAWHRRVPLTEVPRLAGDYWRFPGTETVRGS